ncbi:Mitochondrial translocator assembly and maintenance protein 41 [Mycoemilia scoparia]|uniref:Phosphatidate cytidylyltransferase, mitochondrial n=1 Tax=Mycoemilia scoparia TaxID=417184 RepID=A0A9W7ZWL4_9FUNG|nr:Mitochondrial translocator assembly and maintenance protein 41 [Mycoemilia scoparia]
MKCRQPNYLNKHNIRPTAGHKQIRAYSGDGGYISRPAMAAASVSSSTPSSSSSSSSKTGNTTTTTTTTTSTEQNSKLDPAVLFGKPLSSALTNGSTAKQYGKKNIVGSGKIRKSTVINTNKQSSASKSTNTTTLTTTSIEDFEEHRAKLKVVLDQMLGKFSAPVRYAIAYGSGVYKQAGYDNEGSLGNGKEKPMIDLIFGVSHPEHWHALNMQQHPDHYSGLTRFGSGAVAFVGEKLGAGVYYNTDVEIEGMRVKYGVTSVRNLTGDLLNWETLYLAGRMHKPTLVIRDDPFVRVCGQVNLANAIRVALLMLPKNFTEQELFTTVAGISYTGDARMKVGGENPNKVDNIVSGQLPIMKKFYSSIIEGLHNLEYISDDILQQDISPKARAAMFRKLPKSIYENLVIQYRRAGGYVPVGQVGQSESQVEVEMTEAIVKDDRIKEFTHSALKSIISTPAITQSIKGVLTAGFSKSYQYAMAKRQKALKATTTTTTQSGSSR